MFYVLLIFWLQIYWWTSSNQISPTFPPSWSQFRADGFRRSMGKQGVHLNEWLWFSYDQCQHYPGSFLNISGNLKDIRLLSEGFLCCPSQRAKQTVSTKIYQSIRHYNVKPQLKLLLSQCHKENSEREKDRSTSTLCPMKAELLACQLTERLLKRIAGARHLNTSQCKPNRTDLHRKHPPFLLKKYSRLHLRKHKLSKLQPNVPLIRRGKDTVCVFLQRLKGRRNSGADSLWQGKTWLEKKQG